MLSHAPAELRPEMRCLLIDTYIHTYIIMVLSNLSVSDVSIYFVWFIALLVVRDELEHLWRAISCCRLNRSPQVSHLNGSFARSATVILLLTVPHCGIRLLCRFKSCGRLNCFPHIHTYIHHHHHHASGSSAPCPIRASHIHTYIHTYIIIIIIIMRQDHQLPAQ